MKLPNCWMKWNRNSFGELVNLFQANAMIQESHLVKLSEGRESRTAPKRRVPDSASAFFSFERLERFEPEKWASHSAVHWDRRHKFPIAFRRCLLCLPWLDWSIFHDSTLANSFKKNETFHAFSRSVSFDSSLPQSFYMLSMIFGSTTFHLDQLTIFYGAQHVPIEWHFTCSVAISSNWRSPAPKSHGIQLKFVIQTHKLVQSVLDSNYFDRLRVLCFLREKVATPRRCKENASRQMGATFQLWRLSMGQRRVPRFYLDRQFSRSFPNYIFIRFGNVACDSHNCSVAQLNDRRVFQGNAWTFQYRPDFLRLSKWKSRWNWPLETLFSCRNVAKWILWFF